MSVCLSSLVKVIECLVIPRAASSFMSVGLISLVKLIQCLVITRAASSFYECRSN